MAVLQAERVGGRCRRRRRSNSDLFSFGLLEAGVKIMREGCAMLMAVGGYYFHLLFYCTGSFD
jgi:hypothetical protein